MPKISILPVLLTSLLCLTISSFNYAGISVVNGLTHLYDVQPGMLQKGFIEIQNTGKEVQAVKIYQRDYRFHHNGNTFYDPPGSHSRSNAGWIDISPTYFLLQAGEKTTVAYEIDIPDADTLNGTFWSVIMVEGETPVDTNDLKKGIHINTQLRYAIQVATTFENAGNSHLTFYDIGLATEAGQKLVIVDVGNEGQRMLRPRVSVELFDSAGQSIGIFAASKKKIYPLTSARFMLDLKETPPGAYQALVLADCSQDDVFGINIPLEVPGD